jgi:hypothetical protein
MRFRKLGFVAMAGAAAIALLSGAARADEHRHFEGCGHFFDGRSWLDFPPGHVHGPGCDHFFYDGAWHLFPREHAHGPGCGHYYANGIWSAFPSGHIHSPRCGHFFYEGTWHLFPEGHVHGEGCGHFQYLGCWHVFPQGHVHGPGCGHVFVDGDWRSGPSAPEEDPEGPAAREAPPGESIVWEPVPRVRTDGDLELVPPSVPRQRRAVIERAADRERSFVLSGNVFTLAPAREDRCARTSGRWDDPSNHVRHICGPGCGHYYWMSDRAYHEAPYPRAPVHEHGIGCGHFFWDGAFHAEPAPWRHLRR